MARRANPTVIGAFVVGAVALAVAGLVIFSGGWWFRDVVTVVMYFDESVNGLSIGAPVAARPPRGRANRRRRSSPVCRADRGAL